MGIDFVTVLIAVISLILLAVPAFILNKMKLLPEKASEVLSTIVLYGCQPALVFMSFQGKEFDSSIAMNMLIVAGIAFAVHLAMFVVVKIFVRGDSAKLRCVRAASVFGNCAYMGVPFLQTLFGASTVWGEIMIYTAVVLTVFNILNWTLGVYLVTGSMKNVSLKKIILNPTIIAIVLGFVLFITLKKPLVDLAADGSTLDLILTNLANACNFLGNTVTPLAMFVIGIRLSNLEVKKLFSDKWAYITSFLKLVVCSLITIAIIAFLPISMEVKNTLFFLLSMPCATSTALFAVQFGADGDSASIYVLLSTVLSIVVIPLMYMLFSALI
ncbi:MAG: hypothetical protein E7340_04285 [Clostridiales bacterium]|nr:hypothetical protein [Clostridiales bacterium]